MSDTVFENEVNGQAAEEAEKTLPAVSRGQGPEGETVQKNNNTKHQKKKKSSVPGHYTHRPRKKTSPSKEKPARAQKKPSRQSRKKQK
jgi:hypothetical protein